MKVKDLMRLLEVEDPNMMVLAYMERNGKVQLFEIDGLSTITGKWDRDDDGTPTVRMTSTPGSTTRLCIDLADRP